MISPEASQTTPPPPAHAPRRRRKIFFAVSAVAVLLVLYLFREILLPFLLAMVIAYVFAPIVDAMQRVRVGKRFVPRWLAVLTLYIALLTGLGLSIAFGAPRLFAELQALAKDAPHAIADVRDRWVPEIDARLREAMLSQGEQPQSPGMGAEELRESDNRNIRVVPLSGGGFEVALPSDGLVIEPRGEHGYRVIPAQPRGSTHGDVAGIVGDAIDRLADNASGNIGSILGRVQTVVKGLIKGIFSFFIMLMLSAYLLATSPRILAFFRSLVEPHWRRNYDRLVERIDRGLAGVVRGQLIICVVNGILSGIGFYLLELKYWPILTLAATILSIIPIFGAILSSVPAVLVALQASFATGLFTLAWIVGIHQIEANLLNPKIMGDQAKVHPVLVVFALLAGEHFYGFAGALLAVPTLSIAQSLFLHYRDVAMVPSADSLVPPKLPAEAFDTNPSSSTEG